MTAHQRHVTKEKKRETTIRKPHLRGRGPHFPLLDTIVQYEFEPGYVAFTMPSPKRLRVQVGWIAVADTTRALVFYKSDHLPVYYFPIGGCSREILLPSKTTTEDPVQGRRHPLFAQHRHHARRAGAGVISTQSRAARQSQTTCPSAGARWATGSKRTRRSSSMPAIRSAGSTACPRRGGCKSSSTASRLPIHAVASSCSRPAIRCATICRSPTPGSICSRPAATFPLPYKGISNYYHVTTSTKRHENLVWYYPEPVHEAERIKGLVCFHHELVDKILVDGVNPERGDGRIGRLFMSGTPQTFAEIQ